jgi:hypothetical protein
LEDFEETSYNDYEIKLLKESAQSLAFTLIITVVMSYKFNIHMSLLIQSITLPLNLYENMVFKKYVLRIKKNETGNELLYNELLTRPTEETISSLNQSTEPTIGPERPTAIGKNEPRVEVLDEVDSKDKSKAETKKSTSAHDID